MRKLTTMAILTALGLLWPSSLGAQQAPTAHQQQAQSAQSAKQCAPYKTIVTELKGNYKEGQAAIGLANNGYVFQLFSTKSGSSWTVLMTKPNGETCLLAAGKGLELIKNLGDIKVIEVSYPTEK